jgi:hypothetical protein
LPHQFLALSNDSFQPFLLQLQKFGDLAALGQLETVAGPIGKVSFEPDSVDQAVSNWLAARLNLVG